jgi:class 3 adenylate cyclase/DNA-binding NarL/FixJ family response regulator
MPKPTILCVDDEDIVLRSLGEQLKNVFRVEYDIEIANSAEMAIEIVNDLRASKIELPVIITDQVMPKMKGDELLSHVYFLTPYTRSVMLTGQANAQAVGNAVNRANLFRYMSKPWEREDLIITVKEAIRSFYQDKSLEEKNHLLLQVKDRLEFLNKELEKRANLFFNFVPVQFLKKLNVDQYTAHIESGKCIECNMTILFADLRSFTQISESMSPTETFQFIQQLFSSITPYVSKHAGFIDKFIGDAMMALFENPDECLKAAISIQEFLSQAPATNYNLGIGINTGAVVLGTVGGSDHMETTVMGDTVNTAERAEKLTRLYNVPLLITGKTYHALKIKTWNVRLVDKTLVRGKHEILDIYEVLDGLPEPLKSKKLAILETFDEARHMYEQQEYVKARELFNRCLEKCPEDEVSRIYLARIQTIGVK